MLEQLGLLRPAEAASSSTCRECDGSRALNVEFIHGTQPGLLHGYIHCSECGFTEIDPRDLDRWRVDPAAVVKSTVRSLAPSAREPTEIIPERLWNAGKVHLMGQLRELFFVPGVRSTAAEPVTQYLRTRKKCIVLVPSELGVARWGDATENLVLAIESIARLEVTGIVVDREILESRIASFFGESQRKTPPKRRESRLGDIDALVKEMVEHLRAARDHAVTTRDLTGTPELLPRPTQLELGKRAGVTESSVSRCLKDENGVLLRRLWAMAADVDAILSGQLINP
jgi:hypothetical protein